MPFEIYEKVTVKVLPFGFRFVSAKYILEKLKKLLVRQGVMWYRVWGVGVLGAMVVFYDLLRGAGGLECGVRSGQRWRS